MKKLLLHTCCGPCLIYPGEALKRDYGVKAYYYNPNIHPQAEYEKRLESAKKAALFLDIEILEGLYRPGNYFKALSENEMAADKRCANCYYLRLNETARAAKELGYESFSTTLLVSPYQDFNLLVATGKRLAKEYGLEFVSTDFRPGFKAGREKSRTMGLYLQSFCGCAFSFVERFGEKNEVGVK